MARAMTGQARIAPTACTDMIRPICASPAPSVCKNPGKCTNRKPARLSISVAKAASTNDKENNGGLDIGTARFKPVSGSPGEFLSDLAQRAGRMTFQRALMRRKGRAPCNCALPATATQLAWLAMNSRTASTLAGMTVRRMGRSLKASSRSWRAAGCPTALSTDSGNLAG